MPQEVVKGSRREKIRELIGLGYSVDEIAERLGKGDERRTRIVRTQIGRMLKADERTQQVLGEVAHGELLINLVGAMEALGRRASRGNVPAIKLLAEMSGFHNPRVQHEHSGEIQIQIKGLPRPVTTDETLNSTAVEDADVVDPSRD